MTIYGKYLKGMEMEAAGKTAPEIAEELGLRDRQAWYTLKSQQKRKQEALNERARAESEGRGTQEKAGSVSEKAWLEECAAAQAKKKPERPIGADGGPEGKAEEAGKTSMAIAMERAMKAQEETAVLLDMKKAMREQIAAGREEKLPEDVKINMILEAEDGTLLYSYDGDELNIGKCGECVLVLTEAQWSMARSVIDSMLEKYRMLNA